MLEPVDYARFALALLFVVSLVGLVALLLKKYQGRKIPFLPNKRMKVLEWMAIDASRKMVIVRADQHDYTLFLGKDSEFVMHKAQSNLSSTGAKPSTDSQQVGQDD